MRIDIQRIPGRHSGIEARNPLILSVKVLINESNLVYNKLILDRSESYGNYIELFIKNAVSN
jgi:hypothetical protein